ncbi:MAG: pyridoxal phosphate-dependent aminotransferase [Kangiellaceae bacterium]|nr:pyridoxal phosphate-dependent aminotransferase [Kangiellaceae bacterium]
MFEKSNNLSGVCYDIRGPVLDAANRLESQGKKILKLNVGNPAPFGFEAPDDIVKSVIANLPQSEGYTDSKGIHSARVAVYQHYQNKGVSKLNFDHIYIGNGVSELILMSMQALLNSGDEILIPAPDYPLWTASVRLASGNPVHYMCDEQSDWLPDLDDIRAKITDKTRGIVLINPNNPTGAVYPKEFLLQLIEVARQHDLIIFSDEIYDKILYDDTELTSTASLSDDVLTLTFSGLSKTYRVAGYRSGWMLLSGPTEKAKGYLEGLNILSSMRLCSNVPAQHAIQTALGGYQSIRDLVLPGGRLYQQRNMAWELLNQIEGVSCIKPKGAFYLFPKVDIKKFNIHNDEQMILDLLLQQQILFVHGRAFNWPTPDHFRVVFLPPITELTAACHKMKHFFQSYKQS